MPSLDKPAIVLAPYGSLSPRALATYERIRAAYEREFPGSQVLLAFTSQLMIKRLQEKEGITIASPLAALEELNSSGMQEGGGSIHADRAGGRVPPASGAGA